MHYVCESSSLSKFILMYAVRMCDFPCTMYVLSVYTHYSLTGEEVPSDEAASTHKLDETKKKRHEVWRRYSEFEILRNFFCSVFPYVSCYIFLQCKV